MSPSSRARHKNVLDRAGESAGLDYWTGTLSSRGMSRADVLVGFSLSAENRAAVHSLGKAQAGTPARRAASIWSPSPRRTGMICGPDAQKGRCPRPGRRQNRPDRLQAEHRGPDRRNGRQGPRCDRLIALWPAASVAVTMKLATSLSRR